MVTNTPLPDKVRNKAKKVDSYKDITDEDRKRWEKEKEDAMQAWRDSQATEDERRKKRIEVEEKTRKEAEKPEKLRRLEAEAGEVAKGAKETTYKAAEALKVTPKLFVWTVGTGAPSYAESVGKGCLAMTGEAFWEGIMDTPGNKDFVKAVHEIIGTPPEQLEYHTTMGMQAGQILEIAVKKAGSVENKKAIRDMLYSMEVETAMGDYKVKPLSSEDSGLQIAAKCVLIQWQRKKPGQKIPYAQVVVGDWVKEVVWPEKYKTADPIYPFPGWK